MKRSRRWLLNGFAVLALLLCAATVVLWVLSYAVPTQAGCNKLVDPSHHRLEAEEAHLYGIGSVHGILEFNYTDLNGEMIPFTGWKFDVSHSSAENVYYDPSPTILTRIGLHAWGQNWGGGNFQTYVIALHYWFLFILFSLVSWLLVRRARWLSHRRPGFCTTCGYDLRATPERCPECGKLVEKTI